MPPGDRSGAAGIASIIGRSGTSGSPETWADGRATTCASTAAMPSTAAPQTSAATMPRTS